MNSDRRPYLGQLDALLQACVGLPLFASPEGQAFIAIVPFGGPQHAVPIRSVAFRDFISYRYNHENGMPPSSWNVRRLLRELESKALHICGIFSPELRHCPGPDHSLFVDLADDDNRCVHITSDGWTTKEATDRFYFRRAPGAQPLPAPEPADPAAPAPTLDPLARLLRLSPENAAKIQSWLLSSLLPSGPYPVLILDGPEASGKSTVARILRSLIDPHAAPFTPHPNTERQVLRQAHANRVLVYDHITHLSPRVQDALARVSTGAGYELRERAVGVPQRTGIPHVGADTPRQHGNHCSIR